MTELHTNEIMDVRFISSTFNDTVDQCITHIEAGDKIRIITANPEIVMLSRKDTNFANILSSADYITPDGVGILIAGKLLKKPIPERITGVELTMALLQHANAHHWRVYLLGAAPDVMTTTVQRIHADYPNVQLRSHHGFFTPDEEAGIIAEVKAHQPHILLVALGAPRQELWLTQHQNQLSYNLAMAVGGTFDVISGKVKRAPLLWQRMGVEWLYRLLNEPRRFIRILALPQFMLHVFARKLKRAK